MLEDGEVYELTRSIEADHHTDKPAEALLRVALDGKAYQRPALLSRVDGEAVCLALGEDEHLLLEGVVIEGGGYGTDSLYLSLHLCLGDGSRRHVVDDSEDPRDEDAYPSEREEHVGECRTELLHTANVHRSASDGYTC